MNVVFVPNITKEMLPRNFWFTIVTILKMLGTLLSKFSLVAKYKALRDI